MEISVFVRSTLAIVSLVATAACTGSSPMSPSAAPTASLSSASVATDAQGGALQGRGGLAPFGLPAGLGFPAVQGGRNVTLVGDIAGTNFEPGVCHPGTDLTLGFPTSCLLFGEGPGQFTREAPGGVAFTTCHCSVAGVGSEATTQVTLKIAYPPATNGLYPGGFTKFTFQNGTAALSTLSGEGTLNFANQGSEISFTYRFNRS